MAEGRLRGCRAMRHREVGVVTGEHWTGSSNKSIDQIGKNCLPRANFSALFLQGFSPPPQKAADVWEKDVWEFQAKSGSSGSCCLFLYFLRKIAVQEMSGKTPGSPRHPSSRHPRPSGPPPRKIHTPNSRPKLSAFLWNLRFLIPKTFSRRFSGYGRDQ